MSKVSDTVAPDQAGAVARESEGGSVTVDTATPLPEGITAVTTVQYRVGSYTYSRLEDAMAEHGRHFGK